MHTQHTNDKPRKTTDNFFLRYLLIILWNHKFLILGSTLLFVLGATLISSFLIKQEYKTTFTIVANVPATYTTKYGEFSSPIKSNSDYINLIKSNEVIEKSIIDMGYNSSEVTVEVISDNIFIGEIEQGQNVFPITVTGNDPVKIVELSNTLYENYMAYIDLMIIDRAVEHFYNDFTVKLYTSKNDLRSNKYLLAEYEKLLENTSEVIDQEALLSILSEGSHYIVLTNIVNPNYLVLETDIVETKKKINSLENNIQTYTLNLEELTTEKALLEQSHSSDNPSNFESGILDISDIFILSEPTVPSNKSSPNIKKTVAIAGVLATIINIVFVILKEYMKESKVISKQ